MKIVIVHDSFLHIGGAEKVLFKFIEKYPEADVFIPLINDRYFKLVKTKTEGNVNRSLLSELPFMTNISSLLKPLLTRLVE